MALLKSQFQQATYYYNVVTLLDRLLYSPAAVRKFFVRELWIEATGSE